MVGELPRYKQPVGGVGQVVVLVADVGHVGAPDMHRHRVSHRRRWHDPASTAQRLRSHWCHTVDEGRVRVCAAPNVRVPGRL